MQLGRPPDDHMNAARGGPWADPTTTREQTVDLISYWQRFVAPFIRARFGRTERGASLVEYALLVALIAIVCIVAVTVLGGNASKKFSSDASYLS